MAVPAICKCSSFLGLGVLAAKKNYLNSTILHGYVAGPALLLLFAVKILAHLIVCNLAFLSANSLKP